MAKFLTTSGMTHGIENIIVNAKSRIILVSPFVRITRNYYERLFEAVGNRIKVTFIYGKNELEDDQQELLYSMKNIDLRFCENLHAKCYMNEQNAIIGSMNLYEYSQNNNREMGISVDKQSDAIMYSEILREVESIIKASTFKETSKSTFKVFSSDDDFEPQGKCIRCKKAIPFDTSKPYCYECYQEWNIYQYTTYADKYCHYCGKPNQSTILQPLCRSCYRYLM